MGQLFRQGKIPTWRLLFWSFVAMAGVGYFLNPGSRCLAQTNPVNVANVPGCVPVAASANFLYTYCDGSSLSILDVYNPANPIEVGYNDPGEVCRSVALSGNHAYVATDSTLDVLDISSPTNPVVVGRIGRSGPVVPWALSTSSHFVYLARRQFP